MTRTRLNLESLHSRTLPSATLVNGVLTVEGTGGRDTIVVTQTGSTLSVRGEQIDVNGSLVDSIDVSDVTRVVVRGGGGHDTISLAGVAVAAHVSGGSGHDVITGGVGDDVIAGGAGNDNCRGGAGDDRISSGSGDDRCNGGSGNDRIEGGRGRDRTRGGGGFDDLSDIDEGVTATSVEGRITAINLGQSTVTITTVSGVAVTVKVVASTKLERNDAHVNLSAFLIGDDAEAVFNAQRVASKLEAEV